MFNKLEWFIANRYLKTKRKESFITIISWFSLIGITLGVAVLIIVMSVMNGFRDDLVKNIIGIEGHITISKVNGGFINNYQSVMSKIINTKEVTKVSATVSTQALLSSQYYSTGVMVKALTYKDIKDRNIKLINLTSNAISQFQQGYKVIIIGKILANSLGIQVGDMVKAVFPQFDQTVAGSVPKYLQLKVVGFFNTGMYQYDSNMALLPLKLGQLLYNSTGVQNIEVFTSNPEDVNNISDNIEPKLDYSYYVSNWQQNNYSLISALNTERNVMFIILVLIIMIAAFNIMSSLIMLVRSKTKEIAILKTIGFSKNTIQNIFIIIGLRTGITGTILGSVIGVVFSLNIERIRLFIQDILHVNLFNENVYFLSHIPAEVSCLQIVVIVLTSIILTVLASIYPARRAAKIITAEALRYE